MELNYIVILLVLYLGVELHRWTIKIVIKERKRQKKGKTKVLLIQCIGEFWEILECL